jgi:hypothetical protein
MNNSESRVAPIRRVWVDAVIVCLLWSVAYAIGLWYIGVFNATRPPMDLSYREFGAAVAQACGHGFVDTGYDATPGLSRFLTGQADTFSCDELPRSLATAPPSFMQRIYRYLMSSAALIWIVRGHISWSGLAPLYGMLYAFTIAAAYGLFRVAMRIRMVAALCAIAFMVSAIHLGQLAYIRDYAKAPFILGLLFIMALMAAGPVTWRGVLGLAAAFGALLGIGFGFRNDLLINVPPFLVVVLVCLPGGLTRNLAIKAAAIGTAAVVFTLVAWPVIRAYQGGSNSGHVALLGLMTTFDAPLGIRGSIYDWGYTYLDGFVGALIYSYNSRMHGIATTFLSAEYDHAAVSYLFRIARHWPADLIARAYASVLKILEMPFTIGTYTNAIPYGAIGSRVAGFFDWQMMVLRWLSGSGVVAAALALIMAAGISTRIAFALLALLLYYAGYPAIQFHVRHFFHLEFIGWLAVGSLVDRLALSGWGLATTWRQDRTIDLPALQRGLGRSLFFIGGAMAILVGGLAIARAYQQRHVLSMLASYADAPRDPLPIKASVTNGTALVASPALSATALHASGQGFATEYLMAEFSADRCEAARFPVTLRYTSRWVANDFSREDDVVLHRQGGPTRLVFPAFYNEWSTFEGIELPQKYAPCLSSLSRFTDLQRFPILLDITLTSEWKRAALYQTIASLESRAEDGEAEYFTAPKHLAITQNTLWHPQPLTTADVAERANIVTPSAKAGEWTIRGRPQLRTSYLLRFKDRPSHKGDIFIAEGRARTGAFLLALVKGEQWSGHVVVDSRGPFVVALEPQEDGAYGILLTADLKPHWPATHIGPWVEWLPGATLWSDVVLERIGWVAGPHGVAAPRGALVVKTP